MVSLDYTFMTSPSVASGFTADELTAAAASLRNAHQETMARHARGELGFFDLSTDRRLRDQSVDLAGKIRARGVEDVVVLGIGGSALGPIALRNALRPPDWNGLSAAARGGLPRLHVLDNIDPTTVEARLARLDLRTSSFVVISKSGSTAETMAQYLIVRGRLAAAGLSARDHLAFVTDPERGALRAIATAEGIPAVDIPPNVGGRFSVLTPVGVLPAALIGIDVESLLDGAAAMRGRCLTAEFVKNPAGALGTLQWLADTARGRHTHVLMPYADSLREMAAWFVQLWAESLGKTRRDGSHAGPTPIGAVGATDQHSQMQLFMEGPLDKTVSFIAVKEGGSDLPIPGGADAPGELAYLGGHSLSELLGTERRATAAALARRGRMSMTITIDRVDAWHLGGLFLLFEMATAIAGELYAVNAFDQPGVELAKRYTYALMGRPGFEDVAKEWKTLPRSDARYTIQE